MSQTPQEGKKNQSKEGKTQWIRVIVFRLVLFVLSPMTHSKRLIKVSLNH